MKKLILLILLTSTLFATPSWYMNRDYKLPEINEVIGYGEGDSIAIATVAAKTDISEQLATTVSSSISIQKEKDNNGNLVSTSSLNQNSQSKTILEESQIIKQQTEDGKWFVVVVYENMTTIDRFVKKVNRKYPIREKKVPSNYFSKTNLGKEVFAELETESDIVFQDGIWKLKYKDIYQNLNDFSQSDLYMDYNLKEMTYHKFKRYGIPNDHVMVANDSIHFEFKSGYKYTSLYLITKKGSVFNFEDNELSGWKTSKLTFEPTGNQEMEMAFVTIQSNEPIDNSFFKPMIGGESLTEYNSTNRFPEFIKFLNGKQFSMKKFITKPNY
jgi:hypothetical protein